MGREILAVFSRSPRGPAHLFLKGIAVRLWRIARALCLAMGALFLVVTFTPLVRWMMQPIAPHWADADRGVLVLLSGSATTYDGSPPSLLVGENTYWRTVHAIAIWRAGHFSKILVCGFGTEEMVKPILLAAGVPREAILIENRSETTHQNALFAKPILAGLAGPYVLVTSDYHMYRAARCFKHEGIAVETIPAPDIWKRYNNPRDRWDCFGSLIFEFAAIVNYRAHAWI